MFDLVVIGNNFCLCLISLGLKVYPYHRQVKVFKSTRAENLCIVSFAAYLTVTLHFKEFQSTSKHLMKTEMERT